MLGSRTPMKAKHAVHYANRAFEQMNIRDCDGLAKLGNSAGFRFECKCRGAHNRVVPPDELPDAGCAWKIETITRPMISFLTRYLTAGSIKIPMRRLRAIVTRQCPNSSL